MIHLEFNHYGKKAVRVLRVQRTEFSHDVAEWETSVLLEGDLAGSYLSDDNSSVVPTDTVRNTVLALAHDLNSATRDEFAVALAEHFLTKYPHLTACDVEVCEISWVRMTPKSPAPDHCFLRDTNGQPFSKTRLERSGTRQCSSGFRHLVILKTTASGFAGFPRCELTTLPETFDRILSTSLDATWEHTGQPPDESDVRQAMLRVFTENYSPSVQRTLYQMGEAVLTTFPAVQRIHLTMPNKHYLSMDLSKLGRPANQNQIYQPTDDPFGFIEATLTR